jgi:peptide/nickel transport system substrate-binding protein
MKGTALLAVFAVSAALAAPQTIRVALPPQTNVTFLIPITPASDTTLVNFQAISLLYKPLLYLNAKQQVDYARSVASSVKTRNGRTYTITLNPKWRWSDGQPVTARDVAFDFALLRSIGNSQASQDGNFGIGGIPNAIAKVKVTGNYSLQVELTRAYNPSWFILNGLSQIYPLPAQAWNHDPASPAKTLAYLQRLGGTPSFLMGSPVDGPFKLSGWHPDRGFSFSVNPTYAGHPADYHKLDLVYFTSSDAEFNALKVSQVQVGYLPTHLLSAGKLSGYRLVSTPSWAMNFVALNFAKAKALRSLAVRQALQMAIDQPTQISQIYHGYAGPQYGPVPPQPPTYLSPKLAGGAVPYPYDPAKGKQLLLKSGWKLQGGVMAKGGSKLSFNLDYPSGSVVSRTQAELLAADAKKEGISLQLRPQPQSVVDAEYANPKGWTMILSIDWTYGPYPSGYGIFDPQGGSDLEGFDDPKMSALTLKTHAFGTSAQQQAAMNAYQDYAAQVLPALYLPNADILGEFATSLKGVARNDDLATGVWAPQRWSYR